MMHIVAKLPLGLLLLVSASICCAQNAAKWKTGDKVETLNLSHEWVPGRVIGSVQESRTLYYRVQLDDANAPNVYFNHTPIENIRARGNPVAENQANNQADGGNPQVTANAGSFKLGDVVDTFYDAKRGHNRGTVIEAGNRRYKIHYTGCASTFDEWVDASLVRGAATISSDAPEIKYLFGRWRTTVVAVGGNYAWGAYAVWGQTPGIQINADGSYFWFQTGGKAPIKGQWIADAKVPGLVEGTPKFDGVIIKDAEGNQWKAFKWLVKNGTQDHIEIDRMCLGQSEVGSRVR